MDPRLLIRSTSRRRTESGPGLRPGSTPDLRPEPRWRLRAESRRGLQAESAWDLRPESGRGLQPGARPGSRAGLRPPHGRGCRPGARPGGAVRSAAAALGAMVLAPALLLGAVLGPAPAASAAEPVELRVVAALLSDEPGAIDPAARQLHEALKRQRMEFRSARVVTSKTLRLAVGETGQVPLPGGRSLQVQPLDAGEGGVLLAVRVAGSVDLDARVPPGRPLVLRAGRVDGAELVVSVEPTR